MRISVVEDLAWLRRRAKKRRDQKMYEPSRGPISDTAHIYRAVILRAVLGPGAHAAKAVDLHRLNQIAEHLAACEEAQTILRAEGHGGPSTTIVELHAKSPRTLAG